MLIEFLGMGEILVDMTPMDVGSYVKNRGFYMNLGGAPFNSAIAFSKLGGKSGVIGAVGRDEFGKFLERTLENYGVDTRGLVFKNYRTSLAFVKLEENGERDFFFYRKPWTTTADTELEIDDLIPEYISSSKVLHVSGMALSHEPMRSSVLEALKIAKENDVLVSFDPTIRLDVWSKPREIKDIYENFMKNADIFTLSLDEAKFLFGPMEPEVLTQIIFERYGSIKYFSLRMGSKGSYAAEKVGEKIKQVFKETIRLDKIVDTTGAGDAWNAAYIFAITRGWEIEKRVMFANVVATLKCRDYGAIKGLPSIDEALSYL